MWLAYRRETRIALNELEHGSDRVVGIVTGALIDSSLTDIIKNEITKVPSSDYTQEIQSHLLQPTGPLGNFGAKAWLAYLLGYLTPDAHKDLQNLVYIRNRFAHYSEHNSFDTQTIKDRCSNFKLVDTRILAAQATVTYHTGKTLQIDSLSMMPNGLTLHLVNRDELLKTPKGRFIATGKLFCAAFETHLSNEPPGLAKPKPVL